MNKHLARWNTCCEKLRKTPINYGETSVSRSSHRTDIIKSVIVKTCQSVQTFLYKWDVTPILQHFTARPFLQQDIVFTSREVQNIHMQLPKEMAICVMMEHEDGIRS